MIAGRLHRLLWVAEELQVVQVVQVRNRGAVQVVQALNRVVQVDQALRVVQVVQVDQVRNQALRVDLARNRKHKREENRLCQADLQVKF